MGLKEAVDRECPRCKQPILPGQMLNMCNPPEHTNCFNPYGSTGRQPTEEQILGSSLLSFDPRPAASIDPREAPEVITVLCEALDRARRTLEDLMSQQVMFLHLKTDPICAIGQAEVALKIAKWPMRSGL